MRWLLVSLSAAIIAFSIFDSASAQVSSTPIVLSNATVIDGTGSPPKHHQDLIIRGELIEQIGSHGQVNTPADAVVLDLEGKYIIPGFVDLHVHFPEDTSVHQAMLNRLLEYGVTTILNPGARPGAGVALRERIETGEYLGPKLFTAGPIIDYRPTEEGLKGWSVEVTTEKEMKDAVRAQAAAGVNFIKLYRRLPPDLVEVAIAEAHALGVPVIGHMGATNWADAAHLGIDMLVHSGWGTPMDEVVSLENPASATDTEWYQSYADAPNGEAFSRLADALVEAGVTVVPTLSITQASGLGKDATLLPQFEVNLAPDADVADWWTEGWRERHPQYAPDSEEEALMMATVYFPGAQNIVKGYFDRGVRLGVGTDVGNSWMTPGVVYHHELGLYQEAGIPPLAILRMATRNGAEALGILTQVGTITAGKKADLIVLSEDPLTDIRNTRKIERVFLAGQEVVEGRDDPDVQ